MEQQTPPNSRLMQVKVLYTFNDENKSNCLARCQQPQTIQTAHLDPSTEVGIIELRTCIQAIVSASPELVAQLGHDYTIYAYDYSEYETPLVGQGMLSWVLASASTTPNAPAHQSKTMVTGRVCKNVLGLFSEGIKETLEVKLRLVPVPTCLQSEYLAGMDKYRSASTVVEQSNFDTAAWTTFLRANPNFGATDLPPTSPTVFAPQPLHAASTLTAPPSSLQPDTTGFDPSFHTLDVARSARPAQASGSRPTTPSLSRSSSQRKKNPPSRPSSRASARGAKQKSKQQTSSLDTSEAEDGPVRKRARITQTDWTGPSNFGSNAESLRVTAATAASIRGDRPASTHPSASDIAAAEPGVRPPTPRPQAIPRRKQPLSLTRSVTGIAHEVLTHGSPFSQEQTVSLESSPEKGDGSSASTPFEIPSSPPVMSPAPSSPQLPELPLHDDSGFMSGNFDEDCFLDDGRLLDTEDIVANAYHRSAMSELRSDIASSDFIAINQPRLHPRSFSAPQRHFSESGNNDLGRPSKPTARSWLSDLPQSQEDLPLIKQCSEPPPQEHDDPKIGMTDPSKSLSVADSKESSRFQNTTSQAGLQRQRSESCAIETTSAAASPAPISDVKPPLKGRQNSIMHEKKKQQVQDSLAKAIKSGQMPRFCRNCGEISTPTWRKAFVKVVEGIPDPMNLTEGENGLLTWETVEKDDAGQITSYRIIKKFTLHEETGYEGIDLCNSCGVWLFKHRCMRPPETWNKQDGPKPPPKPRKRPSKKKDSGNKQGEGQQEYDQDIADTGEGDEGGCADSEGLSREGSNESSEGVRFKKPRVERSNSVAASDQSKGIAKTFDSNTAKAALTRAIQSSPPRFPGSKFTPINVEEEKDSSSRPTRRMLFPSPRKPGEVKSLEDPSDSPSASRSPCNDKENQEPAEDSDDELNSLFNNDDAMNSLESPSTSKSPGDALKTPIRPTSTSARRRLLLSSASRRKLRSNPTTPSKATDNPFALDPEQMTPFTRQLTQLISEANQSSDPLDPTFGSMDGGMFAFSDFSMEDGGAGLDLGPGGSSSALFGMYDDQLASSDGLWSTEDMNHTIDAFLQETTDDNLGESVQVGSET